MKRTGLILSLVSVASCAATFPAREVYVTDVTNRVCAKYEIYDLEEIKVKKVANLELLPMGPCDRAMGFKRQDVNGVLNWIRKAANTNREIEIQHLQNQLTIKQEN